MKSSELRLDLNNPIFQEQLFSLPKQGQAGVLSSLRKLSKMTWEQVYRDAGIRWEVILSRSGPRGQRLYSCIQIMILLTNSRFYGNKLPGYFQLSLRDRKLGGICPRQ